MIDIINALIRAFGVVLSQLFGLLPASPLVVPDAAYTSLASIMGVAAWFLPFAEARVLFTALIAAILIWYGIRIVLRFFRLAGA